MLHIRMFIPRMTRHPYLFVFFFQRKGRTEYQKSACSNLTLHLQICN